MSIVERLDASLTLYKARHRHTVDSEVDGESRHLTWVGAPTDVPRCAKRKSQLKYAIYW